MSVRHLDLLDLPLIARYRNDALTLDSVRVLTRGHPLGAAGFLTHLNPARHLYAAIAKINGDSILGGIIHRREETFAKLLYLTPASQLNHPELPALIEHLAAEAGKWGAFHVIAEVEETSEAFDALRKAGFSVYAWQRVWDVSEITGAGARSDWRRARSFDLPVIQSLYHQIVPPLLHPVEPPPSRSLGFINANGMKCYASAVSGMNGILFMPFVHPEAKEVSEKLTALVSNLAYRRNRPVYFCVRSYQTWLEPVLEDLGAKAAPRQAVMVKRLARLVAEEQPSQTVTSRVGIQPSRLSRMDVGR